MKKNILPFIICIMILICQAVPSFGEENQNHTTLKVAFYPLDGFFEYDANNQEMGYGVDLLNKISEYTGIRFEYVPADSWEKTQTMLKSGEADIRMPGSKSLTGKSQLGYTEESVMDTYHALMTLKSRKDLYYSDSENYGTMKVAVTESMYYNTNAGVYIDQLNISSGNMMFCESYDECRKALEDGKVDALISNIMDLTDDMKILNRFCSVENYITMMADNPYLSILDDALYEIKMDNPTFLPSLYEKYYPERTVTPLTREESEYIKSCGTIIVGMLPERYPFSRYDEETGKLTGINEDILAWIADYTGLKFKMEPLEMTEKTTDALKSGHVDIVCGVLNTNAFRSDPTLQISEPFNTTKISIVKKKGFKYDSKKKLTAVTNTSFKGMEDYINANYPKWEIIYRDTTEQCLDAVASGDADILLQNVHVMNYYLQKPRFASLEMISTGFIDEENCFLALSDMDPLLFSVINKVTKAMPEEELNSIIIANTTARPYQFTVGDTLYKYRIPIIIIGMLSILLLALFCVIAVVRSRASRRMEEKNIQLADAVNQAQIASQAKSEFLARMSHEIRTPMNAIIGIATLAADHTDEPDTIKEDLKKIDLSSHVLLSIINDVLDMSAIESGKLKIDNVPFDFKQLISSMTTVYYAQCHAKGISFQVKLSEKVDERIVGDQLRLNQILMNLLSNAVKFTEKGSVTLSISQETAGEDKLFMSFTVKDTGAGMDEEMQSRLFKPFEQESANTARQHGGSGLGLSIVKNLVTMMNGAIDVSSTKGEGSVFNVRLPFGCCDSVKRPAATSLKNLRVLVIDNECESQDYVTAVLERVGARFSGASDGEEALSMLEEAAKEKDAYNICIIDWKMPDIDGTKTIRSIRERYSSDELVIIASIYDYSQIDDGAKAAGADRFVTKPLFQSTIVDLLMDLSGGETEGEMVAESAYDFTGRRILLAEDNNLNRIVGVGLLKKAGIICETAVNGKEALDMFNASEPGYYDAILMDIQMPVMDGYEATEAIRKSSHCEADSIPIIAMTANAFTEDIATALQKGMNDHVAKPIELAILLDALERVFTAK